MGELYPYLDEDLRKFWWMALTDLMRGHYPDTSQWRMSGKLMWLVVEMMEPKRRAYWVPHTAGIDYFMGIPIEFDDTADVVTIEAK